MIPDEGKRIHASPRAPCPVCERKKSCSWADGGLLFCMGVGDGSAPDGWVFVDRGQFDQHGFRHLKRDDGRTAGPRVRFDPPLEPFGGKNGKPLSGPQRQRLADHLRLPVAGLDALPFGWDGSAWTWPETDGGGVTVGIARRFPNGNKGHVTGGSRGLAVFAGWRERPGSLLVCEGMSDGLAATCAGLVAVSRPNATEGADHLAELLRDWPADRGIVFLADNDAVGVNGARAVAAEVATALGRSIRVAIPPDGTKDARTYLTAERWGEAPWPERGAALLKHVEGTAEEIAAEEPLPAEPSVGAVEANGGPPDWPAPIADEAYHGLAGGIATRSNRTPRPIRWRCWCNC